MFINYKKEQWPEWLETTEFIYNNKMYSSTKTLPFKANYRQNPRMRFEGKKKEKYEGAEKFIKKIKEKQEKEKVVLGKVQEKIKKYTNRKRGKVNDYRVGDLVMLSTKDLKLVSSNTVKLELPSIVKIYLVVNISGIQCYVGQVKGKRKE